MRAAQERLPPKKRELPAGAGAGPGRGAASGAEAAPAAGWAAEQCGGLLYKVAVPPGVSVSALAPASFSVAPSPLLQPAPAGLPYSPVHYAPLPPAPLHFVGAPYPLPYALPPAFVPGPLLPAGRLPHFVPYASLLLEDAAAAPPALAFAKTAAPLEDAGQGGFPLHYQLPGAYSALQPPGLEQGPELPPPHPKLLTANGVERPSARAKQSEVPEPDGGGAEGAPVEPAADNHFFASSQSLRTDVPMMTSQRSTPDTDLEVQRVVGVLASQDYLACSGRQQDGLSPLNLSHRSLPEQEEEPERNPGQAAAEKNHRQTLPTESPEELLYHNQIPRGLTMANGKAVLGPLLPAAQGGLGRGSPEARAQGGAPDPDCAPSRGHLPSHFMKGAIIQLATGELKRVEDLQTQDFVRSAEVSGGLKIDSSTVVDIQESPWQGFVTLHFVVGEQQSKVSIGVPPEHPFFVYGQGWSSCSPERTAQLFALPCHRLQVGDVCISISLQSLNGRLAAQAPPGVPRERLGRASQGFQEPPARAGEESPVQKGALSRGSPPEPSSLELTSQHGWAGPSIQSFGEEPQLPLIRPSFIPQEVKLSIEGRSNAGK